MKAHFEGMTVLKRTHIWCSCCTLYFVVSVTKFSIIVMILGVLTQLWLCFVLYVFNNTHVVRAGHVSGVMFAFRIFYW